MEEIPDASKLEGSSLSPDTSMFNQFFQHHYDIISFISLQL